MSLMSRFFTGKKSHPKSVGLGHASLETETESTTPQHRVKHVSNIISSTNSTISKLILFIEQEAREKVKEIELKTEADFNIEKQNLIFKGRLAVLEEYERKEKALEVLQRVQLSAAVGAARVQKMKARDDLLEGMKRDALRKIDAFFKSPSTYATFMKRLIIQGLIKIEEPVVELQVRAEDRGLVIRMLPECVSEYKAAMREAGWPAGMSVVVTVSSVYIPASRACRGGLVLTALDCRGVGVGWGGEESCRVTRVTDN